MIKSRVVVKPAVASTTHSSVGRHHHGSIKLPSYGPAYWLFGHALRPSHLDLEVETAYPTNAIEYSAGLSDRISRTDGRDGGASASFGFATAMLSYSRHIKYSSNLRKLAVVRSRLLYAGKHTKTVQKAERYTF